MTEVNQDVLLGKLLANQDLMQSRLDRIDGKLEEIESKMDDQKEVFAFLKGQKSAVVWIGGAIIAASAAMGLSASKVFAWLAANSRL